MGLDMYLTKRIYIGANFKHNKISGTISLTKGGKPIKINKKRVSEIIEDVGYWRKANAIHKWFVDNCQDGVDDCRDAYVSKEQLEELLSICKKVKASKKNDIAEDLLPSQSGFFFGGTEIDEGYYQDIDLTIKIIKNLLKEGIDDCSIYYQSSW